MSPPTPSSEQPPTRSSAPAHAAAAAPVVAVPRPVAGFVRGLWRIAGADASSGNRVALLKDGPATFDAMLALIDKATKSVSLESYIFRHDEVGERFFAALAGAAARGVHVRVLVDWIGVRGTRGAFFNQMERAGVEVRIFSPPSLRRAWLGLVPRDHRKLLVVDDAAGIVGGVGIGREWATGLTPERRSRWRDTAVLMEGPVAHDLNRAFAHMWLRAIHRERRGSHRLLTRPARGANLDPSTAAPALIGVVEGEPFRLRVARALQIQAVSAERSIWIASAYFVPSFAELEALTGAARDGVDVRLLVPSRSDHRWMTWLTRRSYRRLLMNGVRVWEWQGAMMHAKTAVIDGRWVRVGSTDFNPLGIAINYELDVLVEDAALGAAAERMFVADMEGSREITL